MNTLASDEISQGIRVFRTGTQIVTPYVKAENDRVYVTIGAGETMITVLNDNGHCEHCWTALFGWSFLFDIPLEVEGECIKVDDREMASIALGGRLKLYGRNIDTRSYVMLAGRKMKSSLDDILAKTIGGEAKYSTITFTLPEWLHKLFIGSVGVRPLAARDPSET